MAYREYERFCWKFRQLWAAGAAADLNVSTKDAESPLDLFWVQNSGLFLDIKIITFLDFDLKFLIFSGCPRKVGNLVSFAVVSILHIVLICFRDTYF